MAKYIIRTSKKSSKWTDDRLTNVNFHPKNKVQAINATSVGAKFYDKPRDIEHNVVLKTKGLLTGKKLDKAIAMLDNPNRNIKPNPSIYQRY